jgi:hypothetical protein
MKNIQSAKLTQIEVAGVNRRDYPDFVDAYVEYCLIDGREATNDELYYINTEMPHVAQEKALNNFYG